MKFSIRRFNEWLIVGLVAILIPVLFSFIRGDVYFLADKIQYIFNPHPTTVIMGISTVDAINMFGGDEPSGYSITWKTASMYLNVVLYLMIGPYLLFKGYKRAKENEHRAKPWFWYIGGVLCLGALSIIPVEVIHLKVFQDTKASAIESRHRDLMRAELAEVGFATAQYEILEDGVDQTFNVDELNLENLNYIHSVESIQSDTLITLKVTNPDLPEYSVKMEVRPYSQSVLKQRN